MNGMSTDGRDDGLGIEDGVGGLGVVVGNGRIVGLGPLVLYTGVSTASRDSSFRRNLLKYIDYKHSQLSTMWNTPILPLLIFSSQEASLLSSRFEVDFYVTPDCSHCETKHD